MKMDPPGLLTWMLPGLVDDFRFDRWLDTNLITFPDEPKRHCNTIARLTSWSGHQAPWAGVVEVEAGAERPLAVRLLEYLCRLMGRLRNGLSPCDRYQMAGVVPVLTGRLPDIRLQLNLTRTRGTLR